MRVRFISALCLLALPAAAQTPGTQEPGRGPPARPELLLREVVTGLPRGERQEIQVLTATIAPGQSTVFHTHRHPVTVYMLAGTFTLELEGQGVVTVGPGQALVEPPQVRMTGHNRSATEPARIVIFYVSEPGAPFLDLAH
jgi:quercetin dioxygenase-like cupin family protein